MPSRLDPTDTGEVDPERPYDIYVAETQQKVVVYRRAFFRGVKHREGGQRHGSTYTEYRSFASEFMEIGQANGDSVFVRRYSIVKFCDPETKLTEEQANPPASERRRVGVRCGASAVSAGNKRRRLHCGLGKR